MSSIVDISSIIKGLEEQHIRLKNALAQRNISGLTQPEIDYIISEDKLKLIPFEQAILILKKYQND